MGRSDGGVDGLDGADGSCPPGSPGFSGWSAGVPGDFAGAVSGRSADGSGRGVRYAHRPITVKRNRRTISMRFDPRGRRAVNGE
ncbi:hypothetical protein [Actinomadura miaoliensis]|uniref:Uncharacterized protein n=1 Tax=Actinomadura miaoliensis TaxID=430685 RepID=A0ABP7WKW0_9ACTN